MILLSPNSGRIALLRANPLLLGLAGLAKAGLADPAFAPRCGQSFAKVLKILSQISR